MPHYQNEPMHKELAAYHRRLAQWRIPLPQVANPRNLNLALYVKLLQGKIEQSQALRNAHRRKQTPLPE